MMMTDVATSWCIVATSQFIVNSNNIVPYVLVNERAPPQGKPTEGWHPYTHGNDLHPWVYGCGCCTGRGAGWALDTRGLTPGIPYCYISLFVTIVAISALIALWHP